MKPHAMSILSALLLSTVAFFHSSCTLIGGYNARAHEQLTSLKACHLKIIDDSTAGEGHSFSADKFEAAVDAGELKFREAEEFSNSTGDKLRSNNLQLLHGVYKDDTARIRKKGALLNTDQAGLLKDATVLAYEQALKGESVRPGGP